MRFLRELAGRTFKGYYAVHAATMASSMSYFALATIAPLGVLTIWASELLRQSASTTQLMHRALLLVFGPSIGEDLSHLVLTEARMGISQLGGVLALLFLIYGAASLFLGTQRALNVVWRIRVSHEAGLGMHVAIRAAVVFATIFVPAALVLTLAVARDVLSAAIKVASRAGVPGYPQVILAQLVAVVVTWGVVVLVYRILPDAKLGWRSIFAGGSFTAVTWVLATWLFTTYFSLTVASRYQVAGSAIALLMWVFLMSQFFLAGARLAYEHACMTGQEPEPRPWAEPYEKVKDTDRPG